MFQVGRGRERAAENAIREDFAWHDEEDRRWNAIHGSGYHRRPGHPDRHRRAASEHRLSRRTSLKVEVSKRRYWITALAAWLCGAPLYAQAVDPRSARPANVR